MVVIATSPKPIRGSSCNVYATHVTPSGSCTHAVRNQKISNKSSFGSNDNGDSAAIDRIIVIAETARLIDSGAWQCRSGLQMNAGYTTIPEY